MRWAVLFFCCLLLAALGEAARSARAAVALAPQEEAREKERWPREIKGIGATLPKAEADAVKHALEVLLAAMSDQDIEVWRPDLHFVRRHVLRGEGRPGPEEEYTHGERTWTYKTWIVPLQPFPAQSLNHFHEQELRAERSAERRLWTLGFFAMAALAGLIAFGIMRLGQDKREKVG